MKIRLAALVVLTLLTATGCGRTVLDSADLDRSISKLRSSVEESRRPAFDAAIALVRDASRGEISGTQPFPLDGMGAEDVFAEAERISIRRDRELERESAAAHREILEAEERLARLAVVEFVAQPIGATRMEADVTVNNGLDFAVETAWLEIEVAIPEGDSSSGEEFVAFQPPLAPGERRQLRILVSGNEARSLPVEPPAELRCRFRMAERGGEVALRAPTPGERRRAEADLAESERKIAELDARLAAVQTPQ